MRREDLGALIDVFQEKSFALIFILLLGVPALPLPTGGATHVFEIIAIVVALQLVAGRDKIWLPERWCKVELGTGGGRTRFLNGLMKAIRWIERFSRPRLRFLFDHRASNTVLGLLTIAGLLGAFLAPPFTGLDTLPTLGVVLLSLGVLLEDFFLVVLAVVVGAVGVLKVREGTSDPRNAPTPHTRRFVMIRRCLGDRRTRRTRTNFPPEYVRTPNL